jgi:hypothetical protein
VQPAAFARVRSTLKTAASSYGQAPESYVDGPTQTMGRNANRVAAKKERRKSRLTASAREEIRAWEERNGLSVLSNPIAEEALATLFYKQCDPVVVLESLRLYSGDKLDLKSVRRGAQAFVTRTKRLARRLKEDAQEVRSVEERLKLAVNFPKQMDDYADYLLGLYREEVKGTVLSRGAGLQVELVNAVNFVRTITGRPHFPELVALVRAIGIREPSEGDLRKVVSNFGTSMFGGGLSERALARMAEKSRIKCAALGADQNS